MWTFRKEFYGRKGKVNLDRLRQLILKRYIPLPFTIFDGWKRKVFIEGDYKQYRKQAKVPFPDLLKAQNPNQKSAIHLSGGFDSSIISYLYDRPDIDYIHVGQNELAKAKIMAKTLAGKLHELVLCDEEYWRIAEDILPQFPEPEVDIAAILSYYASFYAKKLGHDLIITGDCADRYFGGNLFDRANDGLGADIWKTLHSTDLLNLKCLMPFGHPDIGKWADKVLKPKETDGRKLYLKKWCRRNGFPKRIVNQKKVGWGGASEYGSENRLGKNMLAVIMDSKIPYVRQVVDPEKLYPQFLFVAYSVTRWLERNYEL